MNTNEPNARMAIFNPQMWPTRVPIYDRLGDILGDRFKAFYPTILEGDRDRRWAVPAKHAYHLLKPRSFSYTFGSLKRFVHINPDIWAALKAFDPDCVVIYGFSPTALLAWLYTRVHRKKFVAATDGSLKSDRKNTPIHFLVRRLLVSTAVAVVGASQASLDLFNQYGDFDGRFFYCYLCADNKQFATYRNQTREYDVMFAGQFIDRKLPHFFVDVVAKLREVRSDISAVLMGDGPQRPEVLARLDALGVRYRYVGFVPSEERAAVYGSARLFLFPSKQDAYGVVANEALAVGTPVISNDEPGAVGEVILDGRTGYVLPLDAEVWAEQVLRLLSQPDLYYQISAAGFRHVQKYTYQAAAAGLIDAFEYSLRH